MKIARHSIFCHLFLLTALPIVLHSANAQEIYDRSTQPAQPVAKKFIKAGFDSPTPAYVRDNLTLLQSTPVDGIAIGLPEKIGEVFNIKASNEAAAREQIAILKQVQWGRLTDNFIRVNTDSTLDWTNDDQWGQAMQKLRLVGEAMLAANAQGIIFDPETYSGFLPWRYSSQPRAKELSYAQYSQVLERRGREFMEVLQEAKLDIKILSYYLYNVAQDNTPDSPERRKRFETYNYNLLLPFIDGMLEAAGAQVTLTNINEPSYYYKSWAEYNESYLNMKRLDRNMVPAHLREKAQRQVRAGQCVYADFIFNLHPDVVMSPANALTGPEQIQWWEHNNYYAQVASDEYVVVYSNYFSWTGQRNILPGVNEALQRAKEKYLNPVTVVLPKIDLTPVLGKATAREAKLKQTQASLVPPTANINKLKVVPAPWQGKPEANSDFVALTTFKPAQILQDESLKAQTNAWVAYDSDNLYLRFYCHEPKLSDLQVTTGIRDHAVWQGDHVELILQNPTAPEQFYRLMVNPGNSQWDGIGQFEKRSMPPGFNTTWTSRTGQETDAWWAELVVPWKSLKMSAPAAGQTIRANVSRRRLPEVEQSFWSPVRTTGPVALAQMGTWKF